MTGRLEDVAEIRVLSVRQVIETVGRVDFLAKFSVLLVVAVHQVPPQEQDDAD